MPRSAMSYDAAAHLLYKYVMAQLTSSERTQLESWASCSTYNRRLMDDLRDDPALRIQIIDSFYNDHSDFWKIVVLYRAALHEGTQHHAGRTDW